MPLYVYECKQCQHGFEAFSSVKQRKEMVCPRCGSSCNIILTAPNVQATKPFITPHIDGKPRLIKSKGHMREVLKEHNERTGEHLSSSWLDGGVGKNPETPKPLRELEDWRRRDKIAKRRNVPIERVS